jgi:trimethylamine--corrinoid protein Co-methyltransferase
MDLDRGRRFGTLEDFRNFIRLAQASPNFHHSGGTICEPTDIPVNKRHLDMVMAHLTLSDAQAMMEGTMSMLAAIHCGANFILHSAGFLDGLLSMSYEKFMLDADLCGALHSYLDGIRVEDDQLAVEAFAEVGPGNHFFGCSHTMAHYQTAFWDSALSDNEPFEKWEAAGREDAATRANRAWKRALAEYEPPPMDEGLREGLADFVERRKASMADMWY